MTNVSMKDLPSTSPTSFSRDFMYRTSAGDVLAVSKSKPENINESSGKLARRTGGGGPISMRTGASNVELFESFPSFCLSLSLLFL